MKTLSASACQFDLLSLSICSHATLKKTLHLKNQLIYLRLNNLTICHSQKQRQWIYRNLRFEADLALGLPRTIDPLGAKASAALEINRTEIANANDLNSQLRISGRFGIFG